ncbi:Shikimate dehydrogenase (NADP(+)) [Candidatus Kinetoplastibacterium sorsogonicusi]|uniref:Shikimate dehydrogenase (NADP(+)) n=1 Tax=Candidatus Kinetoplastidibacterium kentomonadis TaxID=1576550 RepID=A0A3S7JAK4_9PROT|nr:shikimate dehydrogenase [Candidatus Kinetoplastibacterium sorsogonicusi]AWD32699.1 Shikimate dehydrogenase (NADP(+)) [Candidatus Kinetoplastibacterium sorsogonicusi]
MKKNIKLFAVIGNPINHSKSPKIHNYFAKQNNINQAYTKILSSDNEFKKSLENFIEIGGLGLNVTVPFKQTAFNIIKKEYLSKNALLAEAVNTIHIKNNLLYGYNTDGQGFINDLIRLNFNINNSKILLIGAGGAARGIIISLIEYGCSRLHIINRNIENAMILMNIAKKISINSSHNMEISYGALNSANIESWPLVINTTSSSLQNQTLPLPENIFSSNSIAYDLYYSNQPTLFLKQAKDLGAKICVDGLGMLIEQAAESFYIWHGIKPDTISTLSYIRSSLDHIY